MRRYRLNSMAGLKTGNSNTILLANAVTKSDIKKYCAELGEEVPANLDQMTAKAAAELQIKLWQRTAKYKRLRAGRLKVELEEKLANEISCIRSKMEEAA